MNIIGFSRNFLVLSTTVLSLTSCAASHGPINYEIRSYAESISSTTDQMLLTNILRAKYKEPMHFTSVPKITESIQQNGTLGIPIPFGGPDANGSINPTIGLQVTPALEVDNLSNKDFSTGFTTPVDPSVIQYWVNRGVTPKLLMLLFVSHVDIVAWERNNPSTPPYVITLSNDPAAGLLMCTGKYPGVSAKDCDYGQFGDFLTIVNESSTRFRDLAFRPELAAYESVNSARLDTFLKIYPLSDPRYQYVMHPANDSPHSMGGQACDAAYTRDTQNRLDGCKLKSDQPKYRIEFHKNGKYPNIQLFSTENTPINKDTFDLYISDKNSDPVLCAGNTEVIKKWHGEFCPPVQHFLDLNTVQKYPTKINESLPNFYPTCWQFIKENVRCDIINCVKYYLERDQEQPGQDVFRGNCKNYVFSIGYHIRSGGEIVRYLGEILALEDRNPAYCDKDHPIIFGVDFKLLQEDELDPKGNFRKDKYCDILQGYPDALFLLQKRRTGVNSISVSFKGSTYFINDSNQSGHTMEALAIVNQIFSLSIPTAALSGVQTVRILP